MSRGQNGHIFVRKKPNKSGSVSVQVIDKSHQGYRVVQTIGSARDSEEINRLVYLTSKLKTVDYLYRYQGKTLTIAIAAWPDCASGSARES